MRNQFINYEVKDMTTLNILDAPFVKEMMETTANMYRLGWDERNGGNVSYLLNEEEVANYLDLRIKSYIDFWF